MVYPHTNSDVFEGGDGSNFPPPRELLDQEKIYITTMGIGYLSISLKNKNSEKLYR